MKMLFRAGARLLTLAAGLAMVAQPALAQTITGSETVILQQQFGRQSAPLSDILGNGLTPASPPTGSELIPCVQGGVTSRCTITQLGTVLPYLGPVATGATASLATIVPATATWAMSRSAHWTRARMTNPTLVFPAWYLNTTYVEQLVLGGTLKASIETSAGVVTQCAGGAAVAPVNGFYTLTCPGVDLPADTRFFVRALQVNANGVLYSGANVLNSYAADEGLVYGTGTPSDLTTGGTVASSYQRRQGFTPIAILAQTNRRTFMFFGTSKERGIADMKADAYGDLGTLGRMFGVRAGYIDVSIASSMLQTYLAASHPYMDALVGYVSDVIDCHGVNDIGTGGDTAATLAGRRAQFAALPLFASKRVTGCTLSPYPTYTLGTSVAISSLTRSGTTATATVASTASLTSGQIVNIAGVTGASNTDYNGPKAITVTSSTTFTYPVDASQGATAPGTITYNDAWSTTANQVTTGTSSTSVQAFNALERAGIAGEQQILDISDFEDPYRQGKWPVSRDPSATVGTPGFATAEGLHESTTMLQILRDRSAGRVSELIGW